ncbi:MAG: S24 family peptidase [Pseudomonadota bacterium]
MNRVKGKISERFHSESGEGVEAVLARMVKVLGNPMGGYAEVLDINQNTLKTWKRRGEVSPRYLAGFAKKHDVSLDWLMRGDGEPGSEPSRDQRKGMKGVSGPGADVLAHAPYKADELHDEFIFVPHYNVKASAGHGSIIHSEQVVDHLAFREKWVRDALGVTQKDLALISVKGDSMEPTLSNGDQILIDMRKGRIEDDAVYVLQYNGVLLVKRIQRKLDGSVVVKSDNQYYEPETLDAKAAGALIVVGRVVWAGRRM